MKLDRNKNEDGTGKYALILMRKLDDEAKAELKAKADHHGFNSKIMALPVKSIDDGRYNQFFVIRYRDKFAAAALQAYACAVRDEAISLKATAEWVAQKISRQAAEQAFKEADDLFEFADEMDREAQAARGTQGKKLPS